MPHPRPILVTFFTAIALALVACQAAPETVSGIVSQHGRLRVAGNKITGADGQPVSLAGVSYGWSQWEAAPYFNAGVVNWLKQDWHATVIRAPLGVHEEKGYLQDPEVNLARITRVVDAAIAADIYVIIDWHDHHAPNHTEQAVAFFQKMARQYGQHPNIIYEIFNEPYKGLTWAGEVKPYAEKVIAAIRAIDPDNLIVVGTPNWSQDVDIAAGDPIKANNIAYTLHFYAGTHKQELRDKAVIALNKGLPLFVTEWGTCEASGDGPIDTESTKAWMEFMRHWQLSHCNWAIYTKKETAAILVPGAPANGGWSDTELTASGRYVRDLVRNWPEYSIER